MRNYYLAHPLSKRLEVRKFQLRIEGKYNIKFINPFYNNEHERKEIEKLDSMKYKKDRNEYKQSWDLNTCHNIVNIDLEFIRKSDGLVAYMPTPTIGTVQEVIMAAFIYRIPVYIITKDYMYHPWLKSEVARSNGRMFKNITEFKKYLKETVGERK